MKWILGAILIILAIGFAGMLLTEITVIHVTTISDRNYLNTVIKTFVHMN